MSVLRPHKTWWTATEIAGESLPDLPGTRQGVETYAKRQGWRESLDNARQRAGKGGGWEYAWELFPLRARKSLLKEASTTMETAEPVVPAIAELQAYYEGLPSAVKEKTLARLSVLQKVSALEQSGVTRFVAVDQVAHDHGVSDRTVWNWFKLVDGQTVSDWLYYLAPKNRAAQRADKQAECSPEFMDFLKSIFLQLEAPTFAQCFRDAVKVAKAKGWNALCNRTARRRLSAQVPRVVQVYAREGVTGLERCFPPMIRSKADMHALQGVNADCHKFDVFVEWEDGAVERCQIIAFQDLYSGKILSWRIDHTPNEVAVMAAFGEMIETWGIPEHCTFDNGREFAAKWLTGGCKTRYRGKVRDDDPLGVLPLLGIKVHWARPASGQSKPIERAFRDLASDIAKDIRFAGAYVGNRPDAKPENYKSHAVPIKDFVRVVDERIIEHNARLGRLSETANGRSFDETFNESYEHSAIRRASDEQKRLWLMGHITRTLQKNHGRLTMFGNMYWSDWMAEYPRKKVSVRFDIDDLHSGAYIYELTGEFLGFAPCKLASGFYSLTAAKENARAKSAYMRAQRKLLKQERRMTQKDLAATLDANPVLDPVVPENKIVAMPKGDARSDSARVVRPTYTEKTTPEQAAELVDFQKEFYADKARKVAAIEAEEGPMDRFKRALEVERLSNAGERIGEAEASWYARYRDTAEYRTRADMYREFGESYLKGG